MRKLLLFAALLTTPVLLKAQYYWDYGGGIGAANYLGEMGGKLLPRRDFVADMKLQETRQAANIFARYKLNRMFSLRANASYACIRGADSLSQYAPRYYRNLSFKDNLFEFSAECDFFFYEVNDLGHTYRYRDNFRTYVGLGLGALHFNPKAYYDGGWVALRPLMTEGVAYSQWTLTIPAVAGFYFTINRHYRIGWNLNWRTTFSDYLDDCSRTYVAQTPGSLSAALANRTNTAAANAYQPGFANNYGVYNEPDGSIHNNMRGESIHKDSYITSNVEFSYVFRGKSSLYRSHYSYLFSHHKYRRRKIRAKF